MNRTLKTWFIFITAAIIIMQQGANAYSQDMLKDWANFASSASSREMVRWLKDEAFNMLSGKESAGFKVGFPSFYGRFGIFITLVNGKKVRGCFGAFSHSSGSMESVLREYLKGALRQDNRHKPPGIEELSDIDIIVTITSQPHQVAFEDIDMLDISRYGIMIVFENSERVVFVPAEIRTHSYMRQLIGRRRIANVSAFRAVTIR